MSQSEPIEDSSTRALFEKQNPGIFYLDPDEPGELMEYLKNTGLLAENNSPTTITTAGAGNMNCTVRVNTDSGSYIVKQARPWVEKYPQFAAPWDRALREIEFYQMASRNPKIATRMPKLLHADQISRLLVLEDIGERADLSGIYQGERLNSKVKMVDELADYLSALHSGFQGKSRLYPLANREMRALNHAHIFDIPLNEGNGLVLDNIVEGLQAAANNLRSDQKYVTKVRSLGREVYLADGDYLVHGDFFPGSVLLTPSGPKVIDPEFAFFGRPEFDCGVFLAHLLLGLQPPAVAERFLNRYLQPTGFDILIMLQLAGVEVMRRLIGYAQLPLDYGIAERQILLRRSRELVLNPDLALILSP